MFEKEMIQQLKEKEKNLIRPHWENISTEKKGRQES